MRKSGCTLAEILLAGQWRSISFMEYLDEVPTALVPVCASLCVAFFCDQADLEKEAAFEVAVESDEEEWID